MKWSDAGESVVAIGISSRGSFASIRLPELQHEIRSLLASARTDLAQLPEQSVNHIAKASKIVRDFLNAVEKHLEGAPGKNGLHQSIRQPFREFAAAIKSSAPDFRPHPASTSRSTCSCSILPYEDVVNNNKAIYLDEVKELANV